MSFPAKVTTFLVIYALGILLTFAWIHESHVPDKYYAEAGRTDPDRKLHSVFGGIIWPIYWGGSIALAAVRYARAYPGVCK